jgi:hypothetical protein
VYTIYLQDANVCVQVMMLIQSRCAALADPSARTTTPLSPLQIGSSPMTHRQKGKQPGHKAAKRKSKLPSGHGSPGNDENCVNGTARSNQESSRRLSAMSMSPGTPLREQGDQWDESPFKKSKNSRRQSQSDGGMEVVDLLGLSEMPTTPAAAAATTFSSLPRMPPVDLLTSFADSALAPQLAHISQSVLLKSYLHDFEVSGEPLEALLLRMRSEGVDEKTIGEFQRLCEEINEKKNAATAAAASENDPLLKYQVLPLPPPQSDPSSLYQKMLKSGIPPQAVRHKMKLDGISEEDQTKLLGEDPASAQQTTERTTPAPAALPPPPPQLPPHLRKYQVPLPFPPLPCPHLPRSSGDAQVRSAPGGGEPQDDSGERLSEGSQSRLGHLRGARSRIWTSCDLKVRPDSS